MKTSALIIAIISLATVACSTQKKATSTVNDDVYYSPNRVAQPVTEAGNRQTKARTKN